MKVKGLLRNVRSVGALLPALIAGLVVLWGASPVYSAVAQKAVVATVAPDYSSGAHSVISVDPKGGPRSYTNDLDPTISDITVCSYEDCFYILERTGRNNVTKYHIDSPSEVIWQWSVEGDDTNSNPHDLVFVNTQKAYLLRYGSNTAWIVNPSATTEANFKVGELNLSAYGVDGNVPNMHSGVIANGKLFITLQRMDATWTAQTAYVAVFDVSTNQEIDTGKGLGDMLGIPLPIKNPGAIQFLASNGVVYVQGSGQFYGTLEYSSGIAAIDPATYDVSMVLDDGDAATHLYGFIAGMAILSPTKGYFIGYAGWGDNTLYTFNPSDPNPVGTAIPGFQNIQIAGMESGVYFDKYHYLWVCNQTGARVDILNTGTDTVDESVGTNLDPSKVVFCDYSPPPPPENAQTAVVAAVAPDYSSGAHSMIYVDPVGGPRTYYNDLSPTISDITVSAYGKYFYMLERMSQNNVTKYSIDDASQAVWQWSTQGDETTPSNPYDLVFASEKKAYLLRYGSNYAWIVNPSATAEADFKIGELDLSAYGFEGNVPNMHSGVIADGKLFITLQRLDAAWAPQTAYVAVFDVATNQEIDTGKGSGDMLGIPLPVKNPGAIQYLSTEKIVYVQGVGSYWPIEYSGGIAAINPSTYSVSTILDDGDEASHPYGLISGMAILSAQKGYFVGYAGWGDNTLYAFDPSSKEPVGTAVSGLENKQIAGMESGVYFDKNNFLWVCNQTDARVDILNTSKDVIDESVPTDLNPSKVVFCQASSPTPPSPSGGDSDGGCFIASAADSRIPPVQTVLFLILIAVLCFAGWFLGRDRKQDSN